MPDTIAAPAKPDTFSLKRQVAALLTAILDRVYGGNVHIVDLSAGTNLLEGLFRDGQKLVSFEFNTKTEALNYKFVSDRLDSADIEAFEDFKPLTFRQDDYRSDRKSPPKCVRGLSCGLTCIEASDICNLQLNDFASPQEIRQIKGAALMLGNAIDTSPIKNEYSDKTIRELQRMAQEKDVYRANHLSKSELQRTLRTLDQDPDSQEKLRRTLEKRRVAQREGFQALKGRGKGVSDPVKVWKQLTKISNLFGTNPQTAAILSVALLAGVTAAQYNRLRDDYKSGLPESAQMALQRAKSIPVEETRKPNIMFAVGGFSGIGSSGKNIQSEMAAKDNSGAESWFSKANHIIPFTHKEFDIATPSASPRNADGSYNSAYLGQVATGGLGKYVQNLKRGRNDAAVDLAAQMYAYGNRYPKSPLNVLAHGAGGNVVDEASEILSRMKSPESKMISGASMLDRLNVVRLGSPSFGFANDKFWKRTNHRTITSSQDPFSSLPKKAAQWISTVRGGDVRDYLGNNDVRDRIRDTFGFNDSSLVNRRQQEERSKQRGAAFSSLLKSTLGGPAAATWQSFNKVIEFAQDDPIAAATLAIPTLIGAQKVSMQLIRRQHASQLEDAVPKAQELAASMTVPKTGRGSYLVTVGGTGVTNQQMSDQIRAAANANAGEGKRSFLDESCEHIVPGEFESHGSLPDGVDETNPMYFPAVVTEGFKKVLSQTLKQGNNNDSVRLAAQLHALGLETSRGKKAINLVAYDTGGITARDAMEILKKMKSKDGMESGESIAKRIQFTTLGTPDFGIIKSGPESKKSEYGFAERQIMGRDDPMRSFPLQADQGKRESINGVAGHNLNEYLSHPDVIGAIESSAVEAKSKIKPRKSNAATTKVAANPAQVTTAPATPANAQPVKPLKFVPEAPNPEDTRDPRNKPGLSGDALALELVRYNNYLKNQADKERRKTADLASARETLNRSPSPSPDDSPSPSPSPSPDDSVPKEGTKTKAAQRQTKSKSKTKAAQPQTQTESQPETTLSIDQQLDQSGLSQSEWQKYLERNPQVASLTEEEQKKRILRLANTLRKSKNIQPE